MRNITLLFVLVLTCVYLTQGVDVQNATLQSDKYSLNYLTLDIKSLNVLWNISSDPCYPKPWAGVGCQIDNSTGYYRVVSLNLMNRGLSGKIAPTIVGLSALNSLLLSNNNISGDISKISFQNLTQLTRFHLDNNKFTGNLPSLPPSLTGIVLRDNAFVGPIPTAWFDSSLFTVLDDIYVSNNQLSSDLSAIPISKSPLKYIDIQSNNFYGALPLINNDTFPFLIELTLSNNHFSSKLSNIQTFYGNNLILSGNPIKDSIPSDFSTRFPNLGVFMCDSCLLTGALPYTLPSTMISFTVENNQISGILPPSWANFNNYSALQSIYVASNQISGSIPQEWSKMMFQYRRPIRNNTAVIFQLEALDVSNNRLTGRIPDWLVPDPRLLGLYFSSRCNNFDRPYPNWCEDSENCNTCQTGDGGDNKHLAFLWFLLVPGCLVCCLVFAGGAYYYKRFQGREGFTRLN